MIDSKLNFVGCQSCIHFNKKTMKTCGAFPKAIPMPILEGEFDHRKTYLGDGGLTWESNQANKEDDSGDLLEKKKARQLDQDQVKAAAKSFMADVHAGFSQLLAEHMHDLAGTKAPAENAVAPFAINNAIECPAPPLSSTPVLTASVIAWDGHFDAAGMNAQWHAVKHACEGDMRQAVLWAQVTANGSLPKESWIEGCEPASKPARHRLGIEWDDEECQDGTDDEDYQPLSNAKDALAPIRRLITSFSQESLDGLLVWANPEFKRAVVDRMDWYDKGQDGQDPAQEIGDALELLGYEVEYQNEGARPMRAGWERLVERG